MKHYTVGRHISWLMERLFPVALNQLEFGRAETFNLFSGREQRLEGGKKTCKHEKMKLS